MNNNIKWLFTIAHENDIPKEVIYEYIQKKFNKDSVKELSESQLKDVTEYVCDSRQIKTSKQIYMINRKAEDMLMSREYLNHLATKYGAHNLEELDENGIRGIMAILSSLEKKFLAHLPRVKVTNEANITIDDKLIYHGVDPIPGIWVMRPRRRSVTTCLDRYISNWDDISKKGQGKIIPDFNMMSPFMFNNKMLCWGKGKVTVTPYMLDDKLVAITISGCITYGDIYDYYSNSDRV